jgi:hypothetical protein
LQRRFRMCAAALRPVAPAAARPPARLGPQLPVTCLRNTNRKPFALPPRAPSRLFRVLCLAFENTAAMASKTKAEHDSASEFHRNAGSVVVSRHRGGGCVSTDYVMQFSNFNTFVADVRLCDGFFYFEIIVAKCTEVVQFGFCTRGFEEREDTKNQGVGDDEWSWAVDGNRQLKWHRAKGSKSEDFGSKWVTGDVIGFALDMRTPGAAIFSVSVNGSFAAPNGVAFRGIRAPYLSPSFTGYGKFCLNFGDRAFTHAPSVDGLLSVHDANKVGPVCDCIPRSTLIYFAVSSDS